MNSEFFIDTKINQQLDDIGFAVVKNIYKDVELSSFKNVSLNHIDSLDKSYKNGFKTLTKGIEKDKSKQLINEYFVPKLNELLNNDAEILPGVHLIKNRGFEGKLGLHQDSAIVEESKYKTYSVWMPLFDTNRMGGALSVVPGSHRLNNHFRSPVLENPLNDSIKKLEKYKTVLSVKAGSLIIFDNAMFHGSQVNLRHKFRVAVNGMIKLKSTPLVYYFPSQELNKIDVYQVDDRFYEEEDIYTAPKNYKLLKTIDVVNAEIDFSILETYKEKFNNFYKKEFNVS